MLLLLLLTQRHLSLGVLHLTCRPSGLQKLLRVNGVKGLGLHSCCCCCCRTQCQMCKRRCLTFRPSGLQMLLLLLLTELYLYGVCFISPAGRQGSRSCCE
jgi:hypothetical protein